MDTPKFIDINILICWDSFSSSYCWALPSLSSRASPGEHVFFTEKFCRTKNLRRSFRYTSILPN